MVEQNDDRRLISACREDGRVLCEAANPEADSAVRPHRWQRLCDTFSRCRDLVASSSPRRPPVSARVRQASGLLVLAPLILAACSDGASDGGEVVLLTEIAVGEPDVEVDPSGTFAVVHLETKVEAVCAVSYGTGIELGMIATDQDMAGAGHQRHEAVLGGLAPDTEYLYRLQAIGPDGSLYRSELSSFRTPPASSDGVVNIALGATILDVSSEFSASFAAEHAVDGDPTTEWASRGDGDDAYIVIDLGSDLSITGVGFRTRSMSDDTAITTAFSVTIDDGANLGPFDAGPGLTTAKVSAVGRMVRVDVASSTGGNTGAIEIEIYGAES